jgi:anti-anti-sigma factor
MTVVPHSVGTAMLICDRCGRQDSASATTHEYDVVWPMVAGAGWTGSAFATGQHLCPRCEHVVPQAAASVNEPPAPAHSASYGMRAHADIDAVVVTPLADINACFTETLHDGLTAALDVHRHVVLDLHAVHLIDPAGLGLLVRTHQQAKHRGGSLRLVAPSRFILTVLHTMRLDTTFASHPDEEAAFQAVRVERDRLHGVSLVATDPRAARRGCSGCERAVEKQVNELTSRH